MRIDFHFTPDQVDEIALREKYVVVIDVLRSSTTIAAALTNGAREIIPVASLERAVNVAGGQVGDLIIRGGERNGRMIEGFTLGNSPREYTEEKVKGKGILFTTSNGTLAIEKARFAKGLAICGFVNMSRVVKFLSTWKMTSWSFALAATECSPLRIQCVPACFCATLLTGGVTPISRTAHLQPYRYSRASARTS